MSMNEKQIVGESFEDLSDADMMMLTGRGDDGVAPASIITVTIPLVPLSLTTLSVAVASVNHYHGSCR